MEPRCGITYHTKNNLFNLFREEQSFSHDLRVKKQGLSESRISLLPSNLVFLRAEPSQDSTRKISPDSRPHCVSCARHHPLSTPLHWPLVPFYFLQATHHTNAYPPKTLSPHSLHCWKFILDFIPSFSCHKGTKGKGNKCVF